MVDAAGQVPDILMLVPVWARSGGENFAPIHNFVGGSDFPPISYCLMGGGKAPPHPFEACENLWHCISQRADPVQASKSKEKDLVQPELYLPPYLGGPKLMFESVYEIAPQGVGGYPFAHTVIPTQCLCTEFLPTDPVQVTSDIILRTLR